MRIIKDYYDYNNLKFHLQKNYGEWVEGIDINTRSIFENNISNIIIKFSININFYKVIDKKK